jgi:methionine aminopeptidase
MDILGIKEITKCIKIPSFSTESSYLDSLLAAAAIHKKVRQKIRPMIQPGTRIFDIAKNISDFTRYFVEGNKSRIKAPVHANGGIPFPPCISIGSVVAHHIPSSKVNETIKSDSNVKIDMGVHINGWAIDSAFTCYFDPSLAPLHDATYKAITEAINKINLDVRVDELGKIISEIVESTEMEYKGKKYNLKIINGLSGHGIIQNNLHADPRIRNKITQSDLLDTKFTPGVYAVEPLVSIIDPDFYTETTDFKSYEIDQNNLSLYPYFKGMYFSDYDLDYYNQKLEGSGNYKISGDFISKNPNDIICHYEHTIYLGKDGKKIILSQDEDY